jgi:hypothetical protein
MSAPPVTEPRLVDVVDRMLERGVILRAELWLTVADIDLVFIGADVQIVSAERMHRLRDGRGAGREAAP